MHGEQRRWGSMFEVTVEDSFAAGHYLRNYKGKCENPHGHNYKVRVTLAGEQLDSIGLLYDFVHLKQILRTLIGSMNICKPRASRSISTASTPT